MMFLAPTLEIALPRHRLVFDRTLVLGVLNVTPDSFSDGGLYLDARRALERARRMVAEGADALDVGGESTRPGAEPVTVEEELRRVVPVIEAVRSLDVPISVDTRRPEVAEAALAAGAEVVNDISGLRDEMLDVLRRHGAAGIAMHMLGEPRTMQQDPRYGDVVSEVAAFLAERQRAARAAGVAVLLDPGIGFGKSVEHNLELLRNLRVIVALGAPVVVGTSRKSFLGKLTGAPVDERVEATVAADTAAVLAGARVLRVHHVLQAVRGARIADALRRVPVRDEADRIVIVGLRCQVRVGVSEEERRSPQEIVADLELRVDLRRAGATDRLDATIDYVAVAAKVHERLEAAPAVLLEALAEHVAATLLEEWPAVVETRVRLHKPRVAEQLGVRDLFVEASRRR
jgi:dihydropteroate synthase